MCHGLGSLAIKGGTGEGNKVRTRRVLALEHDPEKWIPVFGKDHAQTKARAEL
jgi:hypothetical protein